MEWGLAMFDSARALVCASLEAQGFRRGTPEFKVQLFLRTYGGDLRADRRQRVAQALLGAKECNAQVPTSPRQGMATRS